MRISLFPYTAIDIVEDTGRNQKWGGGDKVESKELVKFRQI